VAALERIKRTTFLKVKAKEGRLAGLGSLFLYGPALSPTDLGQPLLN